MSAATLTKKKIIHYPDSDGQPVADNTLQYEVMSTLKWNIEASLCDVPDVFIGGDLLVYAVEGNVRIRVAPDVLVAFGRPRGYRGSYRVWDEDDIFPQVVIEVWSPNNRYDVMQEKFDFYEKYGAEEYYIIYPDFPAHADGWIREGDRFKKVSDMNGFISPRLKMSFVIEKDEVKFFGPDGREFYPPDEMIQQRNKLEREVNDARHQAEVESARAAAETARASTEAARAEAEKARAEAEKARAEAEKARAEALTAKLRALGVDPNAP